jgi:hypothetical protein
MPWTPFRRGATVVLRMSMQTGRGRGLVFLLVLSLLVMAFPSVGCGGKSDACEACKSDGDCKEGLVCFGKHEGRRWCVAAQGPTSCCFLKENTSPYNPNLRCVDEIGKGGGCYTSDCPVDQCLTYRGACRIVPFPGGPVR